MYKEAVELIVKDEDKGKRLDQFINENISTLSRSYVQNLIDKEKIVLEGRKKIKAGLKLKGNEKITVTIPEEEELEVIPENIPIDIVYEDRDIVIINKNPDMVVHPAPGNYNGTLVNAIMYHIKDLSSINGVIRPGIVHRLDKDTSGLIVIAKNDRAHISLAEMFQEKKIDKYYIAIVKGKVKKDKGRIETNIGRNPKDRKKMAVVDRGGKRAISNFYVLDRSETHTLLLVGIETGRTHQIRVHMKYLGNVIEGDQVYARSNKYANRQMLHAFKLLFTHPISNGSIEVEGDLPFDIIECMQKVGLNFDIKKINEVIEENREK